MRRISIQADEAARQWNKTKDPSFRDQWYKLLKQVPKPENLENERRFSSKKY
jgi:hypothetical protein